MSVRVTNLAVVPATGDLLLPALGALFGALPVDDRRLTILALLEEARLGRISFDHLLVVRDGGVPAAASSTGDSGHILAIGWALEQAGRTAYLYPPVLAGDAVAGTLLMTELCRRLDAAGILACQCLAQLDDPLLQATLLPHGFIDGGKMTGLLRDLAKPIPAPPRRDVIAVPYEPQTRDRFAALLDQTYLDSFDFPELGLLRGGHNALDAHATMGTDTQGWWMFHEPSSATDVAVLLAADQPETSDPQSLPDGGQPSAAAVDGDRRGSTELVYLGVAPKARGRGWGRWMVHTSLHQARARGRRWVLTSVIDVNVYAEKIYLSLGFTKQAESRVYLRLVTPAGTPVLNRKSTPP